MDTEQRSGKSGFVRSVLLYHSELEHQDLVVSFVADGLAMDEPVLVAVPRDQLMVLNADFRRARARAGSGAELRTVDVVKVARNPSR